MKYILYVGNVQDASATAYFVANYAIDLVLVIVNLKKRFFKIKFTK